MVHPGFTPGFKKNGCIRCMEVKRGSEGPLVVFRRRRPLGALQLALWHPRPVIVEDDVASILNKITVGE